MELGTEDIFLEQNRRPGGAGIVQRFGNEAPAGTAGRELMAHGMSALSALANRRVIVKVRTTNDTAAESGTGLLSRKSVQGSSFRLSGGGAIMSKAVSSLVQETLDHKLTLDHLQRIAPCFFAPSRSSSSSAPVAQAQRVSPREVNDTIMASGGTGSEELPAIGKALNVLHQQTENDLWLRGPPPPVTSLVAPRIQNAYSHVRNITQTRRALRGGDVEAGSFFSPTPPTMTNIPVGGGVAPAGADSSDDEHTESGSLSVSSTAQQKLSKEQRTSQMLHDVFNAQPLQLDEMAFTKAILDVMPYTSASAAQQLFRMVDVESNGFIDWEAFVTFLVSQTGEATANPAVTQSKELMPISVPRSCPSWLQHERSVSCMTVSPRTGTVYTGGMDGSVRSWDGVSLRHLKLWYTCPSWIVDIVLTFREQRLIICTTDRQLVVFDAKTGDVLRMYRGRRILETENGINFAHDSIPTVTLGGKIVSHAAPKNVKVRRLRNPASLMGGGPARGDGPPPPNSDGDGPVGSPTSGGSSSPPPPAGSVSLEQFRAQMEEERSNQLERRRLEEYILAGLVDAPSCMEYHYSANDEDVVFFGMSDGTVRLYILPSGQQRLLRLHHTLRCHTARVRMMRVVPAMQAILTCSDDKTIKLTNLESGVVLKHYDKDGHDSGVNSFSYSATMKMFISCGSERCGIVWDQLQESAVARLDEHPCPVLCCFINDVERQFVSVGCDNSVFIFDARTYRLMQQFHERVRSNEQHLTKGSGGAGAASNSSTGGTAPGGGGAGNGNAATRGPGSGVGSYTMGWFDVPRQRLILATTYPVMHQMRRNVATLPAHYCGHTAPVVSLQFNAVFDLALTIDAEHLVLGWNISSGEATGLSFRLNSFASPHEDLRLTSCAFDVQQRRLITGFQTGTVVVWNVFNGSALCVIQAAPSSSPLSSEGVAVNTEVGVEASADKGSSSEVVAVASLQRDGQSLYVFSVGPYLITLKETPQFTVTNVPRWRVPSAVGVVTCMRPCSVVLVACGTSLGALMFFNLMSETSNGHVLFAEDTSDTSSTPTHLLSPMTQRSSTREAARASPQGVPSASPPPRALSPLGDGAAPSHLSRTIAVYPMTRLDHILLAVHADGRVFVWHTRRRLQVATFQLIPKGTGSSIVFTAMDSEEQYLAYTDDAGNVAVFSLPVAAASSGNSPRSHIKLDEDAQELSFTATLQPVFSGGLWIATEDTITNNSMTSAATATSASESFPRLKQVSFFYGFTTSQTSLTLLRQRDKTLVVTTSTDFFTRVFDTEGHFLGELGMGRWRVSDRNTYKYKDRVSSPVLSNLEIPSEFTASGMGGPLMPSAGDIVVTSPVRVNGEPLIEINTPASPRMPQPPPAAVYALPAAIAQQGTITAHLPRTLSPCSSLETPMGEQSAAAVVQQNRFNRRETTTPEAQSSRPVSRAVVPPHLPQLGNPQPRIRTQRAGLVKPAIDRTALVGQDSRLSFSSDQNNDVGGGGGGLPHSPGREPPPLNSMLLGGFSASLNPARGPSGAPITPNSARHPTAAPGGRSLKHVAAAALMAHAPGRSVRSDSISISTPGNLGDLPAGTLSSSHSEQAQRTRILSNHLDHQLSKLRACKSDLNDELKRVEARLARSNAQSTSSASAHGDMHASWTSRVAARLQLHELDDIQPPAGSKSSGDAGRRTHHRVRLGGTGGAGGALSSSRGGNNNQRAVEFFPSVTAPGTLVVGAKDEGAVDSNESSK